MITGQEKLAAEETLLEKKKYMINVDFLTESLIHLNPMMYDIDPKCQPGEKDPKDGGVVYATEDEVEEYLGGLEMLIYNERKVTNLRTCKLCALLPDYDLA